DKVYLLSTFKVDQSEKETLYSVLGKSKNAVLWDKQHFSVKLVDALKNDFNSLVWISLLAVFAVLLISYGRFELAILAMIPLVAGWLWTLGLMGLFGIEFNIFNIIISTFIFGLGVDYAVFILNALIEERKYGHNELTASKLSILLSALTTFAGIGVLIFAKHPALKSIAALSIIGVGSILFLSYTLLPVCYRILYYTNGKERTAPVTLYNLFTSVFAFVQFLTGCATLTGLIPVLLILPVSLKTKKYIVHRLLQLFSFFIVYSIFGIKKKWIDKNKFDLSTPKIIVSNHQSHLDLTLILLMNPKIIVLTNDWVWNNPFYGFIVRFIDYHPISRGMEEIIDPLQKCVNDGYSILVFPEGRRTRDGKISRFHNGAVYLSEKLKLDILPIVIHGANHCMDRNEFFIRNGQVTLKFFDPIKKENFFNKETYIARSNELLNFFRNEFNNLSVELETPDYFSPVLIQSYIYKGPVLEWYLRIKIRLENNYKFFSSIIPRDAVICDIGCGYGFMAAMLKMVAPERRIFAIDYDAQKVELAKYAHKNKEGLVFISGDVLNMEIPKADTIILADVLHYMPEKQQESCIQKCMDSLNINGQIIIRDADTDLAKRTKGTKLTEFFSTRLLGFNKTEYDKLYFFSGKKIEQLALSNGFSVNRIDKTKLTSNVIYILQRKGKI
ncbi:MAG TPA: 1-acyl-sn-glycerol-3-phosphate acyltransferase, partial [Draconibacterium sp.]|nr:1-acyl-sn-glycerol-3-phosphate acyltransferase [Draconibacterium sp.]